MEDIADKYENAMKKGFIRTIILSILKRGPCHGYQIKREIQDTSLGFWDLQDSTLYTVLRQLNEKKLITYKEESVGDRKKKVYHLTEEGIEIHNIIIERQNRIFSSIFSLLNLIQPEDGPDIISLFELAKSFSPLTPDFSFLEKKKPSEKILIWKGIKSSILKHIDIFQNMVKQLDQKIDILEKSNMIND